MDFLGDINLGELGSSGVITLLILVFTVVGFIRGAVKLVFMLFSLAGAGYTAYWAAEVGFIRAQENWADAPLWLSDAMALGAGLFTFFTLHKILSFFVDPFETSGTIARFVVGVPAAIISLIAAVLLIWGSLIFLKDKGAKSEIRYWMSQDDPEEEAKLKNYPTIAALKQNFEGSIIGKAMMGVYQVTESEKHHLAKLLVIAKNSPDKMVSMADNGPVRKLFENPKMLELLEDPKVNDLIVNNDCHGLLRYFHHQGTLEDVYLEDDLSNISSSDLK